MLIGHIIHHIHTADIFFDVMLRVGGSNRTALFQVVPVCSVEHRESDKAAV